MTTTNAVPQLTILVPERNEAKNAEALRGFKILLEIAVRHPRLARWEIPFVLVMGASKGTIREGVRYLRLLHEMRLSLQPRLPVWPPACRRGWTRFGYVRTCP